MITVADFFALYEAARSGKRIYRVTTHHGYMHDYYSYDDNIDFLGMDVGEIMKEDVSFKIEGES